MTKQGLTAIPECGKHFRMMASVARELNFPPDLFSPKMYITAERIGKFTAKEENVKFKDLFLHRFSELLCNNYYIMMSRGRKGCFVLFTNNENNQN